MSNNFSSTQVNIRSAIQKAIGKTKSVLAGMTKEQAQEHLEVSRKNWIRNPEAVIDQRDGSPYTNPGGAVYTIDGLETNCYTNGTFIISQETALASEHPDFHGDQKFYRFNQSIAGTVGGTQQIRTPIEHIENFRNQTVTLSAIVRTSDFTPTVRIRNGSGGTFDKSSLPVTGFKQDGNWHKVYFTINLGDFEGDAVDNSSWLEVAWHLGAENTVHTFDWTHWKLEIGDTATPFESRSYAEELALCQRYYSKSGGGWGSGVLYSGQATSPSAYYTNVRYPLEMRAVPTITLTHVDSYRFPTTASSIAAVDVLGFRAGRIGNDTGPDGFFVDSWVADAEL